MKKTKLKLILLINNSIVNLNKGSGKKTKVNQLNQKIY